MDSVEQKVDDTVVTEMPEEKKQENEFAYIDDTGFTSEIFKIEIRGLPKYYGVAVSHIMPNINILQAFKH